MKRSSIFYLAGLVLLFAACEQSKDSPNGMTIVVDEDAGNNQMGPVSADGQVDAGVAEDAQTASDDASSPEPQPDGAPQIDPMADDDNDGLTNGQEAEAGTDPARPDTDGDGYTDAEEVHAGTSPTNAEDVIYIGGWPYNMNKDAIADPGWDSTPAIGTIMPRYRTMDQYGDTFDLYDLAGRGKKIVLDVGTWFCTPCKAMAQYFSDGDVSVMDEFGWWNDGYAPVLDMINNEEIYWVTVLFSGSVPVSQEDVTRWHDTFPNVKIIVLGDDALQLREYLDVSAMPHIDVLDENLEFLIYETRGPTSGMRHISGLE